MNIEKEIFFMKRVLMIAYHFPPIQGSSGVHRTVQFAKHLSSFGWAPIIVAPHARAYPAVGDESWAKLPEEAIVKRAFAMDSARHLSVKGRYLGLTAIPDRWISWWPGGVFECLRLIRKYKPHVIWSTFPIATAHLIGLTVKRLTGLPWVADFRDPMVQEGLPNSRVNRKFHCYLEKEIVQHASLCTLVSRSVMKEYRERYPDKNLDCWELIANGYDESLFEPYDHLISKPKLKKKGDPIRILHSGILYQSGRNPLEFLKAIRSLVEQENMNFDVVFRGCGHEEEIGHQIATLGLDNIVKLLPPVPYNKAIKEMLESDVLAVFQGSVFNKQIPAKIYEYIRAERPILALVDEAGETAEMLKGWDGIYQANLKSKESIKKALFELSDFLLSDKFLSHNKVDVKLLSRYSGAKKLKNCLQDLIK